MKGTLVVLEMTLKSSLEVGLGLLKIRLGNSFTAFLDATLELECCYNF
jgi:hypothetical protein